MRKSGRENTATIIQSTSSQRLKWLGHVVRMQEDGSAKKACSWNCEEKQRCVQSCITCNQYLAAATRSHCPWWLDRAERIMICSFNCFMYSYTTHIHFDCGTSLHVYHQRFLLWDALYIGCRHYDSLRRRVLNCRFCFASRCWPVAYARKPFHLYSCRMVKRMSPLHRRCRPSPARDVWIPLSQTGAAQSFLPL